MRVALSYSISVCLLAVPSMLYASYRSPVSLWDMLRITIPAIFVGVACTFGGLLLSHIIGWGDSVFALMVVGGAVGLVVRPIDYCVDISRSRALFHVAANWYELGSPRDELKPAHPLNRSFAPIIQAHNVSYKPQVSTSSASNADVFFLPQLRFECGLRLLNMICMRRFIKSQLNRYFGQFAKRSDLDNLYNQLSSLLEVKEIAGSGVRLGPFRGWAISPDALVEVLRDVTSRRTPRVLEFGAGEFTIAIAASLRNMGGGFLVTVEHDAEFGKKISERLSLSGLDRYVSLRIAKIRDYESRFGLPPFRSYDLDILDTDYDVAVVDGPITHLFGMATRIVPLEWCAVRIKDTGVIYLDDAARLEERAVVEVVCRSVPGLKAQILPAEKGLVRIRRIAPYEATQLS